MSEFSEGNMLGLGGEIRAAKDPKIDLYSLVDLFHFSISLGMVGSRKC